MMSGCICTARGSKMNTVTCSAALLIAILKVEIYVWLLVRFSVFPLICSCACNTCGKLVKGCVKLFKRCGRLVKGRADKSLHLGKTF